MNIFLKDEGFQKGIKMPRSFFKGNSEVIEFLGGKLFPISNAKYHFLPLEKVFKIKPGWKAHSRNPRKKVGKKNLFFSLCGYGVILENDKKGRIRVSRNEHREMKIVHIGTKTVLRVKMFDLDIFLILQSSALALSCSQYCSYPCNFWCFLIQIFAPHAKSAPAIEPLALHITAVFAPHLDLLDDAFAC